MNYTHKLNYSPSDNRIAKRNFKIIPFFNYMIYDIFRYLLTQYKNTKYLPLQANNGRYLCPSFSF